MAQAGLAPDRVIYVEAGESHPLAKGSIPDVAAHCLDG
jgi:hypothetical protein